MDDLLVECSIHLDGVPLKDVRTFKCGHGFCKICIDTLFAGPSPFKCPTCRKRIQRKDSLQIFLNPHRSPSQSATQSFRRESEIDNDLALSDNEDSTAERISILRKRTREYATELTRLHQRLEQLQRQVLAANEERDTLKIDHRELQQEHDALDAQHASLKSDCTDLESQRNRAQRLFADLQKKYETSVAESQQWRENCKKAQADASSLRRDKEFQDEEMTRLVERERQFQRRAHANKLAYDKYKRKCDALRQELEHHQRIHHFAENTEDQSLLVVDRDAPDKLEHAAEKDWLDEVCEVRGDTLDVDSDYADDSGKENEDEGEEPWPGPSLGRGLRGRQPTESVDDRERPLPEDRPRPAARFTTAWNLERGSAEYNSVRETKKRKNQEAAVIGARSGKLVKVSLQPALAQGKVKISKESDNKRLRLPPSSPLQMQLEHSLWAKMAPAPKSKSNLPLNRDSSGRLKGAVMLGTRRRFDKNS